MFSSPQVLQLNSLHKNPEGNFCGRYVISRKSKGCQAKALPADGYLLPDVEIRQVKTRRSKKPVAS
jgi:hypothetical protein